MRLSSVLCFSTLYCVAASSQDKDADKKTGCSGAAAKKEASRRKKQKKDEKKEEPRRKKRKAG